MKLKVIVAGGAGVRALGCIEDLLKQRDVSQIVVCDINEDKAKKRVAELGDKRLVAKFLDLSDIKSAAAEFKGADVVANAAVFTCNTSATKAALEAAVNYADLGNVFPAMEEQLALNDEVNKKKGVTCICGCGLSGGLVNVMARYCVDRLDRVESIKIRFGHVDLNEKEHSKPLTLAADISYTTIEQTFGDAYVFDDGEMKYIPLGSNPEVVTFREPVGTNTVVSINEEVVVTLSRSFKDKGIKHVSWKNVFPPKLAFLRSLGLFSKEPINIQGQMVSPREVLLALLSRLPDETLKTPDIRMDLRMIVRGEKTGKTVEYIWFLLPTAETWGQCLSVAALMLARGQIKEKGVLPPELCIPAELYLEELIKRGTPLELTEKSVLEIGQEPKAER